MTKTTIAVIIAVIILLFAGLWYVNKSRSEKTEVENEGQVIQPSSSPVLTASPSAQTNSTDSAMTESVQEFAVDGSNFKFTPSTLTVKKGLPVKITFKSIQGFHDLRIEGLNIGTKQIATGASDIVTFTPDKVGTFEYYCSIGQHRQMGMKGMLVVQ